MYRLFLLISLLFAPGIELHAGQLILNGQYYGRNLYVMNPSTEGGYCVTGVMVNGVPTKDKIQSNAFEIDFSLLDIDTGDVVQIIITYHDECTPRVMNPEVIQPDQDFSFSYIKLDRDNRLIWKTTGFIGPAPFYVEQLLWDRWSRVATVYPTDTLLGGYYFTEMKFHSGINQIRVMRMNASGMAVFSKVVKYNNTRQRFVELKSSRVKDELIFSAETIYELYSSNGDLIERGYAEKVDVSSLEKGEYYLNYDVKAIMIKKK